MGDVGVQEIPVFLVSIPAKNVMALEIAVLATEGVLDTLGGKVEENNIRGWRDVNGYQ